MRVFVFEYITGGGMLDSQLPPSLAEEGDMMLRALVSDLSEIGDLEILVTRDARLEPPELPAEFHMLHDTEDLSLAWRDCVDSADAVWPIAPEYNRVLEHISEAIVNAGKLLLNSPPSAVRVAASKHTTATLLAESGLQVVPTYRPEHGLPDLKGQWVLKPDDGAGCQGSLICRDRDDLYHQFETLPPDRNYVAQPFVQGEPVSLCILAQRGEATLLSVNRQRIAVMDNAFVLLGCVVNEPMMEQQAGYERLSGAIAAALPQLWGFTGIDLIASKRGLQVLEVNPRITTSYVGLRESTGFNAAALVLDMAQGSQKLPCLLMTGKTVDVNLGVHSAL